MKIKGGVQNIIKQNNMRNKYYKILETFLMVLVITTCIASAILHYISGQSYIWQIVTLIWVSNAWMLQTRINQLENK
jgi:hypothetical protein